MDYSRKDGMSHKYIARFEVIVNGVVEPSDVIGAIFGQLEGLLGPELELKELQRTGKIGRINIRLKRESERSRGVVELYSGLDKVRTALLAAAMETVDRVGPYTATFRLIRILDDRDERRNAIARRAVEILRKWSAEKEDTYRKLLEFVQRESAKMNLVLYGEEGLPAGSGVEEADEIIVVEGRADVLNLLKYGYNNVIAMGGAVEKVPKTLVKLISMKDATAFVDGDRGGELVLRTLLEQTDIDYVARAPEGKVVEELTAKEIRKALSSAVPADEVRKSMGISYSPKKHQEERIQVLPEVKVPRNLDRIPEQMRELYLKVAGTDKVLLLDENLKLVKEVPTRELYDVLDKLKGQVRYIVYDKIVTQRIVEKAYEIGVKVIIANKEHEVVKKPVGLTVLTVG